MSSEKVWTRFEGKDKHGRVTKLRIQDLPVTLLNDALNLLINVFIRDETLHKAVNIRNDPFAVQGFIDYYNHVLRDSSYHKVICCLDTDEDTDIIGLSILHLSKNAMAWIDNIYLETFNYPENIETNFTKLTQIFYEMNMAYDALKEFKIDAFFEDEGAVILPEYRGLGIVHQLAKVRLMICEAHKVPMTGAWMTAPGSEKAAAKAGWKTICEIPYDYLAKKYNVTFTNTPPTMKFMVTRARL